MRNLLVGGVLIAIAAMSSAPAMARRTVIDSSGQLDLSGYCDVDGVDCTPVNLNYSVDFGTGKLKSVLIYGNGILTFGPQVAKFDDFVDSLSDYGVPVVSAGINPDVGLDSVGHDSLFQSAQLFLAADGTINARYYYCQNPVNCVDNYVLTLTRQTGGYAATVKYYNSPVTSVSGYNIPGGGSQSFDNLPGSFFIPATFGAVPEPASWALMVAGLGLVGIRRRRRRTVVSA